MSGGAMFCPSCGEPTSGYTGRCRRCGPLRRSGPEAAEPTCQVCAGPAHTSCPECRRPTCPRHLEPPRLRGRLPYRLTCPACRDRTVYQQLAIGAVAVVVLAVLFWVRRG